ncbi:MAG: LPD38 domain-containing protein [Rubrimonas sp.]
MPPDRPSGKRHQAPDKSRQADDPEPAAPADQRVGGDDGAAVAPDPVTAAAAEADPEPTPAQKEAGNYRKGHIRIAGMDVTIENAAGSQRRGTARDGTEWSVTMPAHYGYVRRTEGADGDQVDVYIGPQPDSDRAFVIDQFDPETGAFDEHKTVLGVQSRAEALAIYDAGFSDGSGPRRRRGVTEMGVDEFRAWASDGDTSKPMTPERTPEPPRRLPRRRRVGALPKYPILSGLKASGGVDPDGWLAGELRNLGVTNQTLPGLFRRGGLKTPDTIEHDPGGILRGQPDADGAITYVDPEDVVAAIREELAGNPRRTDEQRVREQAAADARAMDAARTEIAAVAEQMGVTMLPHEIDAAASEFAALGIAADSVIMSIIVRSVLDESAGYETSQPDGEPIPFDIGEPADSGRGDQHPAADRREPGPDAGASAVDGQPAGAEALPRDEVLEAGPDGGQQIVLPGAEASASQAQAAQNHRNRTEIAVRQQQSAMRRDGQRRVEDDEGGLFGQPKRDLFDAPAAARPKTPAPVSGADALAAALDAEFGAQDAPADAPRPSWRATVDEAQRRLPRGWTLAVDGDAIALRNPDGAVAATAKGKPIAAVDFGSRTGSEQRAFLKNALAAAKAAPKPARKPSPARTASEAATSAGQNAASALKNAGDALNALVKGIGNPNKLNMGVGLDPETYAAMKPHLVAMARNLSYAAGDIADMARAIVRYMRQNYGWGRSEIEAQGPYLAQFMEDVRDGRILLEDNDAAGGRADLEQAGGDAGVGDGVRGGDSRAAPGADGDGGGGGRGGAGGEARRGDRAGADDRGPDVVGARSDRQDAGRGEPGRADGDRESGRGGGGGVDGGRPDAGAAGVAEGRAADAPGRPEGKAAQTDAPGRLEPKAAQAAADADPVGVVFADPDNIDATLPVLFPSQREDVLKAETRFAQPGKHGMLFTNGTGTGKTMTGLGIIKRRVMAGQDRILVVAPNDAVIRQWGRDGEKLGLTLTPLADKSGHGGARGVRITTYANFGDNPTLADVGWDMIVADEAHNLMQNQDGAETGALDTLRAITLHPRGLHRRAAMQLRDEYARLKELQTHQKGDLLSAEQLEAIEAEIRRISDRLTAERARLTKEYAGQPRSDVVFLSATPFAYDKTVDYAEGYLFDYPPEAKGGYNKAGGRDAFMIEHFGYRMRYNRLTKPERAVDSEIMEREFHEKLKREGALSARMLDIEPDYDRRFVLVDDTLGVEIDQALDFLSTADQGKFRPLLAAVRSNFDYLARRRLLEAIKAQKAIPIIKAHHKLGRKVVVFHDYNQGGGANPFALDGLAVPSGAEGDKVRALHAEFVKRNPFVEGMRFASYGSAIDTLKKAFPDALLFNGTVPKKQRQKAQDRFNDDNDAAANLIVVQADAGGAGISLHDTSGRFQRVLLNLGMPVKPTTTLQQEGRTRRVGSVTDSPYRYLTIGTDWERAAFARAIAERSGTAENLAMGQQARAIRQSFIDAYEEAGAYPPGPDDGKGGKARDAASNRITTFDRAKTLYFGQQKTRGRRDQREGVDYFATPEPLGLKMVEWAGVRPMDRVLEPSAGHGAIARWFPANAVSTVVEPSASLMARTQLAQPAARAIEGRFEDLAPQNKFDAIVMNPPFGPGGATAVQHLAKAFAHLRNGGRVVALLPTGPAADARLQKLMESDAAKNIYAVGVVDLPRVIFERAGTQVAARVHIFDRQNDKADAQKLPDVRRSYSGAETVAEFFDRLEQGSDFPARVQPTTPEPDIGGIDPGQRFDVGGITIEARTVSDGMVTFGFPRGERKLGKALFARLAAAVERKGGGYLRSIGEFSFKSMADADAFLSDAIENGLGGEPRAGSPDDVVGFDVAETVHARKGHKLFVASLSSHVERAVYDRVLAAAKANGGYYSAYRGAGAVPGFQFTSEADRAAFLRAARGEQEDALRQPVVSRDQAPAGDPAQREDRDRAYPGFSERFREATTPTAMRALRERLDALNLRRVRLEIDRSGRNRQGAYEAFGDGADRILIGAAMDGIDTLNHEAIHAMRARGLFTPAEWAVLADRARASWLKKHDIAARYPHLNADARIEEAIAEEFADAVRARRVPRGPVRTAFQKIDRLLRALRNWMKGLGFETADAVFDRVDSGEVGARRDGQGAGPDNVARTQAAPPVVSEAARASIAAALKGEKQNVPVVITTRLPVLSALGMANAPLVVAPSVIRKAGPDKHKLSQDDIVAALNGLADPVMVFDSATLGGTFMALVDVAGEPRPVVVAIHPNEKVGRIEVTRIASIHAKENADAPLRWMRQGLTRYFNRDAAGAWARSRGLQLPKDGPPTHRRGEKILRHRDVFKADAADTSRLWSQKDQRLGPDPAYLPTRGVWTELTDYNARSWGRIRAGMSLEAVSASFDRVRLLFQDHFLPFRRVQEAIERARGAALPEAQDAYLAEENYSSRAGWRIDRIGFDYTRPILDIIVGSKTLSVESVGDFLYARHAMERNARMAVINPGQASDEGSGMTDAEADRIIADMKASPDYRKALRIAAMVRRLRRETLRERVAYGLLSQAQADVWAAAYKDYVPLKGYADADDLGPATSRPGFGAGYTVRGAESRRALGRYDSRADNPLIQAIVDAQEAVIRGEKNRVAQAVYRLAKANPIKGFWDVKTVEMKRVFNQHTGMVEVRPRDLRFLQLPDNEIALKIDGVEHRVSFGDRRLAEAAKRVGVNNLGGVMQALSMFSRFLSQMRTTMNPAFIPTNLMRDVTAASINLRALAPGQGGDIADFTRRNWFRAYAGASKAMKGDFSTPWARHFDAYAKAGGKIHFFRLMDPEATLEAVQSEIRRRTNTTRVPLLNVRDYGVARPIRGYMELMEHVNLSVDNAMRLAAFVRAKELGWSDARAASLAKNLTVNFNRRGTLGSGLNALFVFANAGIQGLHMVTRALGNAQVRRILTASVALGAAMDQINAAMSDEDEDGELAYDKLPTWLTNRHLVLMAGRNSYNVALPYGFNLFPLAGQLMSKVGRGAMQPGEAIGVFARELLEANLPINTESFAQAITPTFAQPIIEIALNRDWTGRPIYPDNPFDQLAPRSETFFGSVTERSKTAARLLNRITGGDEFRPGAIDVNPDALDHLGAFIGGPAFTFWGQALNVGEKIVSGRADEIEMRDIPVARRLRSTVGVWNDRDRFYRRREDVQRLERIARLGGPSALTSDELRLAQATAPILKAAEKVLRDTRAARRMIADREDLSAEQERFARERIELVEHRAYIAFNRAYLAAIRGQ